LKNSFGLELKKIRMRKISNERHFQLVNITHESRLTQEDKANLRLFKKAWLIRFIRVGRSSKKNAHSMRISKAT